MAMLAILAACHGYFACGNKVLFCSVLYFAYQQNCSHFDQRTRSDAVLDAKSLDEIPVPTNVPAQLDGRGTQHFRGVHVDDLTSELLGHQRHVKGSNSRSVHTAVSCKCNKYRYK